MENDSSVFKILVVRADRLGDVILSTPVLGALRAHYPQAELHFLMRESVAPLLRGLTHLDHVLIFEPQGRHRGFKGFFRLVRELRAENYKIAVLLQSQFKLAAAVFFARIPRRVGPLSKVYSFLFYNRGVRQKRSHVEMHEADYNLQLLRALGIRVGHRRFLPQVQFSEVAREDARAWLQAWGWNGGRSLVLVHPGMGGSALNWPESHYFELIRALSREVGVQVVVTGGPAETPLLERLRARLLEHPDEEGSCPPLFTHLPFPVFKSTAELNPSADPQTNRQRAQAEHQATRLLSPSSGLFLEKGVDRLAALMSFSSVVVAPSTGPLHLAAALGKSVVTFFPPIRVQSAIRWGPYQSEFKAGSILVPEVYCGQDRHCRGPVCIYYPCMRSISVSEALGEVQSQLRRVPAVPTPGSTLPPQKAPPELPLELPQEVREKELAGIAVGEVDTIHEATGDPFRRGSRDES